MRKLATVLAVAALSTLMAGFLSSPASAEESEFMTAADLLAVPAVAAMNDYADSVIKSDFRAYGGANAPDGTTLTNEQFDAQGPIIRDQLIVGNKGGNHATVWVLNVPKKQTCMRKTSTMHWGNPQGDKGVTWTCKKSLDDGVVMELVRTTPRGEIIALDGANEGLTYTWDQPYDNDLVINAYNSAGEKVVEMEYQILANGTYSNKARTAERTTQYFMEPNAHASLVPWAKMKKHWR